MTLTHQTSVATFIQFAIVSLFTIFSQLIATVGSCTKESVINCVIDSLTAVIFYTVVAVAFACIWFIGYRAQHQRSKRMAQLLIAAEGFLALLALFSIKLNTHSRSFIGSIASFIMLLMAVWILNLAFRLLRAGERRVTRRRPHRTA